MSDGPLRIVVALGGNAISEPGQEGDIAQQFARTRATATHLVDLIDRGHRLLITHGNGPQVGIALRRVEIASREIYPLDLGLCVADTQADMGYMICQCLTNEFRKRGRERGACAIVTTVLVDKDDPAFQSPTKPIGQYYRPDEADHYRQEFGWSIIEVPGRGYRRVVPSPRPIRVQEADLIRHLFDGGLVVVAAGGGGIPVIDTPDWGYEGVEAVVDKDLSASLMALGCEADLLAILTAVPKVCTDFGRPSQQELDRLTITEARSLHLQGQFPPGSMGPKIEACIGFLEQSSVVGARALITSPEGLADALEGRSGTWIVRDD